ncbi:MAG: DUF2254 domain-containing protein [Chloroflexi bacterium]|nr:DUF2254 domain-containing protein [Chloroflexota bacterium]
MVTRLQSFWEDTRGSYWFLPTVMAASAALLSLVTVALDQAVDRNYIDGLDWIYGGGPDGARGLLSTAAGSMITVAGVVFSVAIVAMTLASSQFGPRLLRGFIRDTRNQVVLGTFIATFLYSLLVLRTVRGGEGLADEAFVPHISVTVALLLTVASVGVLIAFIHHSSASIQAANLIARVSDGLHDAVERMYPARVGDSMPGMAADSERDLLERTDRERDAGARLKSAGEGYLEAIDGDRLLKAAQEAGLLVRLSRRPGDFVYREGELARAWPADKLTDAVREKMVNTFVLGKERSENQDPRFLVQQLMEVAVRALSTGINDPVTAITCIDRLSGGLAILAERDIPSWVRVDDAGVPRVITEPTTFVELLDDSFTEIRRHGQDGLSVVRRLLMNIEALADLVHREEDVEALGRHAQAIVGDARPHVHGFDEEAVQASYDSAMAAVMRARERVGRSDSHSPPRPAASAATHSPGEW